jgi:hypothetical protein
MRAKKAKSTNQTTTNTIKVNLDTLKEELLQRAKLTKEAAPMRWSNAQVLKVPSMWPLFMENKQAGTADVVTSFDTHGPITISFQQALHHEYSNQLPAVQSTIVDLFVRIGFIFLLLKGHNQGDQIVFMIEPFLEAAERAIDRLDAAKICAEVGPAAGQEYLVQRTTLDPRRFPPGAETALKKAGAKRTRAASNLTDSDDDEGGKPCRRCGEIVLLGKFSEHNKKCRK